MYILLLIMIVVSMWASFRVNKNFTEYSDVYSSANMTGAEVAKLILNRNGIYDVNIQAISGKLTDHYDPSSKTLRLSEPVYGKKSISAISVAAHEAGHAIQHSEGYFFLKFRSTIAPMVSFTSRFVFILILMGIFLESMGGAFLIDLGIILYSFSVLFHIITLPVEFDASNRAFLNLEQNGILKANEMSGSKKVLGAAAMTYVASMLISLIQLIRFISIRRD